MNRGPLLRIDDGGNNGIAALNVRATGLHRAGIVGLVDARVVYQIFSFGEATGVNDGDAPHALCRGVDAVDNRAVVALVVDSDRRVAVGDLEPAVAGTHDLARQHNATASRDDVVDHNRLSLGVEVTLHRHAVSAEVDTGDGAAVAVDEAARVRT